MNWVIVRPGGLSNKTPAEVGNIVVRGEDQLFGRPSDPGAEHALQTNASVGYWTIYATRAYATQLITGSRCADRSITVP